MVYLCRLLAARSGLVQRLCDLRRVGLQLQHHAHVLHQPRSLPGHQEPPQDEAELLH